MGGFIIGCGLAIIIALIVYCGKRLSNKRKVDKNNDVVEITSSDKNIEEKEKQLWEQIL